jgi:hypothetical protein
MSDTHSEILICKFEQVVALSDETPQHGIHKAGGTTKPEYSRCIDGKVNTHLRRGARVRDLMGSRHEQRTQ